MQQNEVWNALLALCQQHNKKRARMLRDFGDNDGIDVSYALDWLQHDKVTIPQYLADAVKQLVANGEISSEALEFID